MSVVLARRVDGPADAPVVVLSPSVGTTWEVWDTLLPALSGYRVVRLDTRGHGRSPVPTGPYTVEELAADVLALVSDLGVSRFGFVGLSLGGAIGQTLAAAHPDRVAAAVLCCALPRFGDPSTWHERAAAVRAEGIEPLAEATKGRWFTDAFRESRPDEVDRHVAMLTSTPPEGYASCCEALATFDAWESLGSINVPVQVVAGAFDPVATPEQCEEMVARIPGAELNVVPEASHIATVEAEAFNRAVTEHLDRHLERHL